MRILLVTLFLALTPQLYAQTVETSIGSMSVSAEHVTFDLPGSRGVTVPRDVVALATSDVDGYNRMYAYLNTRALVLYANAEGVPINVPPMADSTLLAELQLAIQYGIAQNEILQDSLEIQLQRVIFLEDAYAGAMMERDQMEIERDEVLAQLGQAQQTIVGLEEQLASIHESYAGQIAALESELDQAIEERDQALAQSELLQIQVANLEGQVDELQAVLDTIHESYAGQIAQLQAERDAALAAVAPLQAENEMLWTFIQTIYDSLPPGWRDRYDWPRNTTRIQRR